MIGSTLKPFEEQRQNSREYFPNMLLEAHSTICFLFLETSL